MGNLRLPHGEFNVREFYRTTPSPPTYQPQQFIRATPTPSHSAHRPQQFIREIPTPSPPIHHSQHFNQGTPILSPPTQHSQQFMHLGSTLSSLPRIEQECNDSSTPSMRYNSDSQHSTEHTEVQLSIPEQSAGAFISSFNDCQ
ncbi:unnamed protein product [Acanthoscelides obtectus]|uniref:Uncharacterized protein n=1 Tax=Acanthoscelides obtectus TaxID=200917 RepID=A0A9P0JY79_ACAOB|nr:unnamed protein product [Acanthoscelides obtectus]CAK1633919.1 hypothetical protein AOBTE_LOCUS8486 [Acanthoscelides obtectus]